MAGRAGLTMDSGERRLGIAIADLKPGTKLGTGEEEGGVKEDALTRTAVDTVGRRAITVTILAGLKYPVYGS